MAEKAAFRLLPGICDIVLLENTGLKLGLYKTQEKMPARRLRYEMAGTIYRAYLEHVSRKSFLSG